MSHQTSLANHNPSAYSKNASFVYSKANSTPVLDLLSAQVGEKIIDLGCGTGQLTEIIKNLVGDTGDVVGVDSSESMLIKARSTNKDESIKYIQADLQDFDNFQSKYPEHKGYFDAVFTSATLHWCKSSPGSVVRLVSWLLKDGPKSRMAFEFGGFSNTVGVRQALHHVVKANGQDPVQLDPWYFPTVKQYESLLQFYNLKPKNVQLVPRPTPLPTDIYGWLETFAKNTWFADFSNEKAEELMREVQEICKVDNYWSTSHPGVGITGDQEDKGEEGWEIMYVRLRGVAFKS